MGITWSSKMSDSAIVMFNSMFLPIDFPQSVSADYLQYQIYDTIQSFIGYIKYQMLTLSFLKALGVGSSNATLMNAMIIWILRDTTGVIMGLAAGTPYCIRAFSDSRKLKKWRMIAECIRTITGLIEIFGSSCPTYLFIVLTCLCSASNSVASVMETQTRSILMKHFALRNNFSDCAAKESNQDRGIKIFGIPLAFLWLYSIQGNLFLMISSYLLVVSLKLYFTYLSVKVLQLVHYKKESH